MLTLEAQADVQPTLVIAIGNPSRGDDALGPLFAERIAALALPGVEVLSDFQLQIEHALDLLGRREVVFVDAAASGAAPFTIAPLAAAADRSITTHALSPAAVLESYRRLTGKEPPAASVLAIRGHAFELGSSLTAEAAASLEAALTAFVARVSPRRG